MPKKTHIPEVVEPDEALPQDLLALKKFAYLMDEAFAIPGTKRRFGVDAAVGLIPGVGDAIGATMSLWIIVGAMRHRVPMVKIFRMIFNVLLDVAVGAIPLIGDVFDFLFEENVMNLELLLKHRNRRLPPRSFAEVAAAAIFVAIVILGFAAVSLMLTVLATVWLVNTLRQ